MTSITERTQFIHFINEAMQQGARQAVACATISLSERTLQRWQQDENSDQATEHASANVKLVREDGRILRLQAPKNKLNEEVRQQLLAIANSDEFADLAPGQIVPKLADKGIYIASESSFMRVLKVAKQLKHRAKERPAQSRSKPRALCATGPNQLYSWDITYLPTSVKGIYFYLYLFIDIFSRKVVGWQIYASESSEQAAEVMRDICAREGVVPGQVILHSDNGSPMRGATMLSTLQTLGVMPSFSRPSVSNDNPYSESLFKTLKYRPNYPQQAFENMLDARVWVGSFVRWYNHEHQHSSIGFVTPGERHDGSDIALLAKRDALYQEAKARHPERWSGKTRNWNWIATVDLNPDVKLDEKCNQDKEVRKHRKVA